MASLSKKLSENSSETLQAVVELLHDSPSWPDLTPVLRLLQSQTRFLQDIKFEVHRIESMVDGAQRPFTGDDEQNRDPDRVGREGNGGADAESLPTKEQLLGMDLASNWVDPNQMLADEIEDAVKGWGLEKLYELLKVSVDPSNVIPRLRHYILSSKLNKLRDLINGLPNQKDMQTIMSTIVNTSSKLNSSVSSKIQQESDKLMGEMQSLQLPVINRLDAIQSSLDSCCQMTNTSFMQINQALTDLGTNVSEGNQGLVTLITTATQTLGAGISSIITKIEDCCVKQEVSEIVIPTLNTVTEGTSDILRVVRSGGSPVTLNTNGAILAAIKAVQSDISEIRRLL